jgi:TonB family protein
MKRRRSIHALRRLSLAALLGACSAAGSRSARAQEITPPTVLHHVDASYPTAALAAGVHADVVLLVVVGADGHVAEVTVETSGGRELDEAAATAMHQWTFRPATKDGVPVPSRIRVPFHFAPPPTQPEGAPGGIAPGAIQGGVSSGAGGVGAAGPSPVEVGPSAPRQAAEPDEVRVRGRTQPPSRGASDFNLQIGELARVPRANASEMLKLAPGILLTNEGGEGHAEQVFLRGFDAREGQDLEFTMGGVPINESGNLHGNGYADTHFIIPELVQRLRVVEGPFDPRQGNYAVAGSADYELGLAKRGLTAKYVGGSFGTERMLLTFGPKEASDHTFAGVEAYKTDGFGANRDATRGTAMGQYEGKLGQKGSYRVGATAYATHFHTAGVLRDDDFRSGKVGFFDSYETSTFARQQIPEGGDASRYSLYGDVETKLGDTTVSQQVFVIKRTMRLLENFTGFLLDVQEPLQSLHAQRGDMLDLHVDETTIGARGFARLQGEAFGQKQQLELGYFARGDEAKGTQQRLEASTGVPYKTENDLDSQIGDIGLYGDADLRATRWLDLRGGARADVFTYDVLDNCASHDVAHPSRTSPPIDQSCLTQQDFGHPREADQRTATASVAVLPRGSVLLGPFEHFTFSASYGRGVRSIDPSYVTQDVKTPFANIDAYEAGVSYAGEVKGLSLVARSIFFETHVDRDLIFDQNAGRNVLGVGTTRTGWVGASRLTGRFFDEAVNLTLVKSAYDDTHLLVAYVPDVVLRSDTAVFADLPIAIGERAIRGALSSGITYVGPRALPYGQRSQDIFTVDASATLEWRNVEIGVLATNLFDQRYRLTELNYASDFHSQAQPTLVPERHFTAGAPRGIFGTLAINFGGS